MKRNTIGLCLTLTLASVSIAGGCAPAVDDGDVATSSAPLTVTATTWYPGSAPPGFQPGSVSTIAAAGADCPNPSGPSTNITSAWESRPSDVTGNANAILWSVGCAGTTTPVVGPNVLTTALTGIPPEWNGGATQMVWLGQPHLVPIQNGWVALVGLIGQTGDTSLVAHNMAIVLSEDGGHSWVFNSAHLVVPPDGVHAGTIDGGPLISDFTATAAPWTNQFGTHDVFVVWISSGTSGFTLTTTVTYDSGGQFVPATPLVQLSQPMLEPALVAGTHPLVGNFLFLMTPVTATLPISYCPANEGQTNETWKTFFSSGTPVGQQWFTGQSIKASHWWKCAGGSHDAIGAIYPTSARASLTYDPVANEVISATTRLRPGDSTNSLGVRISGFSWCQCGGSCKCGGGAPAGGTVTDHADSQRDPEVGASTIEDQIDPVVAGDPTSGEGVIAWYDTAENPYQNVASVHGQVQQLVSTSLPGSFKIYYPSPAYAFGNDLGLYNGATPVGDGTTFVVGYVDGVWAGAPPNGLGGVYTSTVTP
jgi:hypothetical protein